MNTPRCLKVTCLALILVKQVLVVTRLSILCVEVNNGNNGSHFLLYFFYIPCMLIGSVFEIFLIFYLRHEIRKDSVWWNVRFCCIFTLYSLMFWLYLYWQTLFQAYVYFFEKEHYVGSRPLDLLEHIANASISVLVIVILYRPSFSKTTYTCETAQTQVVFSSSDENVRIRNISTGAANTIQSEHHQNKPSRMCSLCIAVFFFISYLALIALLIVVMFHSGYEETSDFET